MSHFIEYWRPEYAAFAFSGRNDSVEYLENDSGFNRLQPHDVTWLLTRDGDQAYLILRFEVTGVKTQEQLGYWPQYWARTSSSLACPARAIPIPLKVLRQLRFDSPSDRITNSGAAIFGHELTLRRKLKVPTQEYLETLWQRNPTSLWNTIENDMGSTNIFASPEMRKKVELAAVRHVTEVHITQGWAVKSREKDGVGYDLECTKQTKRRCVEVKGSASDGGPFVMTRGECNQAQDNPDFLLAIVTNAIRKPLVKFVTGNKLLAEYKFEPLSYIVGLPK